MDDYDFVEVIWEDACTDQDWAQPDDPLELVRVVSRGWLVDEDEVKVTLAQSADTTNGSFSNRVSIPRVSITSFGVFDVDTDHNLQG